MFYLKLYEHIKRIKYNNGICFLYLGVSKIKKYF